MHFLKDFILGPYTSLYGFQENLRKSNESKFWVLHFHYSILLNTHCFGQVGLSSPCIFRCNFLYLPDFSLQPNKPDWTFAKIVVGVQAHLREGDIWMRWFRGLAILSSETTSTLLSLDFFLLSKRSALFFFFFPFCLFSLFFFLLSFWNAHMIYAILLKMKILFSCFLNAQKYIIYYLWWNFIFVVIFRASKWYILHCWRL